MGGLLETFLQHCLESVNAIQQEREAAKVCRGCDRYPRAMALIDLANPTRFLSLTARLLPYLVAGNPHLAPSRPHLSAAGPGVYAPRRARQNSLPPRPDPQACVFSL